MFSFISLIVTNLISGKTSKIIFYFISHLKADFTTLKLKKKIDQNVKKVDILFFKNFRVVKSVFLKFRLIDKKR